MKKHQISIIALLIILLFATPILAQTAKAKETMPKNVYIGVYILNLGKFDIATGAFTVDFYLNLKCDGTCPDISYEFMNGRASSVDKIIDEPDEKFYRIQANLNSPIDLKKFPFDSQKMQIILEDKNLPITKVMYVPDLEQSGLDPSIAFVGWNMENYTVETKEHYYSVYDETYSQYIFSIEISRAPINSTIKTLLPITFIILVMLTSFVLDIDKITTRLAMVGSALVASVMFHVSLANQIPPVGYLTFIDKFMVLTYFVILLSFAINVFLLELVERKKTDLAEKIHRITEFTMFFIVPILYIILFIFLL